MVVCSILEKEKKNKLQNADVAEANVPFNYVNAI